LVSSGHATTPLTSTNTSERGYNKEGAVTMASARPFVDYYDILQVSPNCDATILESAYRYLAKMYHPDRTGTTDTSRFSEVIEAYRTLRNPEQRAKYDALYSKHRLETPMKPSPDNDEGHDDGEIAAVDDADAHAKILMALYRKRREDSLNPGVIGFYLQEMLNCSDEQFEFHKWYLKEKGFILVTEQGTLAITIQGVDHVISMSRATNAEKLLIAQLSKSEGSGAS
jgi:curved DNA-binding protein